MSNPVALASPQESFVVFVWPIRLQLSIEQPCGLGDSPFDESGQQRFVENSKLDTRRDMYIGRIH